MRRKIYLLMGQTHLAGEVVVVRDKRGELACLVQARAEQARDLLDHRLRRQESGILLSCKWGKKRTLDLVGLLIVSLDSRVPGLKMQHYCFILRQS